MSDYKNTLNLPHTDFPMKAGLPVREPLLLTQWAEKDLYGQLRAKRKNAPRFVLHDGPPYANGHLHCGHALNKILKDMIVKSKSLSGFDAPFVPGWDCHGLPIELNVEKKTGKAGTQVDAAIFREHCRTYASEQIDIQREEFKRLGVFGDWSQRYATMDYTYEANIVRALGKIVANGHLHRGFKPVHWCIECGSALAEAEVEYEDKQSPAIDIAFVAADPVEWLTRFGVALTVKPVVVPVWTTTPWTLPANAAVSMHPELPYVLVEAKECYYVIAEALVESVMARLDAGVFVVRARALGHTLEHALMQHPFYEKTVPLVLGMHVTMDAGTGAVHTAPAHGPDDFVVAQKYDLTWENPVLGNGCFAPDIALFAGHFIRKADALILNVLREKQTLLHEETLTHSYPHCWRHKTPVIFRATPQWFIAMDQKGLRQKLLSVLDKITFLPEWGLARLRLFIEKRPDWCISRQRAWGTPIPFFMHRVTGDLHPDTLVLLEKVAILIEQSGIEAWFSLDPKTLLGDAAADYEKSMDTLDVWFDAGVSHEAVLRARSTLGFPAAIYIEGSDQYRGWFNSSLTTSVAMNGVAPYEMIITHGYTVDAEGKKLSKSSGNYVALDKLIHQHGADILRLWVAAADYKNEVSISEEILKRTGDAYRRIRNTARFLLANLFDFDIHKHRVDTSALVELDQWIIRRAELLQAEIIAAYDTYQFHVVYQKIQHFCTIDLGSFYLDVIKDRQYTTPVNSIARRSCQTAMYHILQAMTRWLAPLLSFTAEEIWQSMGQMTNDSVFLETWYDAWPKVEHVDIAYWALMQKVRDEVNKALETKRSAGVIGAGLAAHVTLYASPVLKEKLARMGDELTFVLITSGVSLHDFAEKPLDAMISDDGALAIHVTAEDTPKCIRCWHRQADVGENAEHPELCGRCVGNITGHDEIRRFA